MARIYKTTDRLKYKIGEIEIEISPLNVHDKATLHSFMAKGQTGDLESIMQGSAQAIKCAVKSIKGLEEQDGSAYQIQFDSSGSYLTDECVADLLNLQESNNMIALCASLIAGVPNTLPKGVSLVEENNSSPKSKAKK